VKYGVTRDSVLGLEVVLADAQVLHTGGRTVKNVAGYDLTRLFVGSEGTLGVITAATLRLRAKPLTPPVTFLATFTRLSDVGGAVAAIIRSGAQPSLLELLDRATVNFIEDYRPMGLDRNVAGLLIGQADDSGADEHANRMMAECRANGADTVVHSTDQLEADMLLEARRAAGPATLAQGTTIIEDVAVPRGRITDLLTRAEEVAAECGVQIACMGHAGDGNIHPSIIVPEPTTALLERAHRAAEMIWREALDLGGTVSGEHGIGTLKRSWLSAQLDATSYAVHQALKSALDPLGILNPGKAF